MLKLNKLQEEAIGRIDENLVVEAGAGTGKTTVLVQRYLEILEKGDLKQAREIESIVAITFTKKAAQEMLERLRGELASRVDRGPQWDAYYRDLGRANISTIHGFCGNILRENTIELGLDPKFQILDENVSGKILDQSVEKLVLDQLETKPGFLELLTSLGLVKLEDIGDQLKGLYLNLRNYGFKLDQLREKMEADLAGLELDQAVLDKLVEELDLVLESSRKNSGLYKFSQTDHYKVLKAGDIGSRQELLTSLKNLKASLGTSKKFQEKIDNLAMLIDQLLIVSELDNLKLYRELLDLMEKLDESYQEEKDQLAGLDYEDLQLKVNELLDRPSSRAYYQDRFRYLMVDEFQDTNQVQREIFYKLASRTQPLDRENLFVVGDPKQSIYGFRGGDLRVFYRVLEDIRNSSGDNVLNLNKNYRTNENILAFINHLFSQLMGEDYSALEGVRESDLDLEVEVLNQEIGYETDDKSYENRLHEAKLIASRIKDLVKTGGYDYGDIALLFRSGTRTYIYERELSKSGLPYYNLSNNNFFQTQEIIDLTNALKAFLNLDDLAANIGFLRSPMVGLSDDSIYLLGQEKGPALARLKELVKTDPDPDLVWAQALYENILSDIEALSPGEILEKILSHTNYRQLVLLGANPRQAYANIEKFLGLLLDYETSQFRDSYHILAYLEELEARGLAQAKIISEDENTIRLMTIHKSKGLEFPVVILPELSLYLHPIKEKILYDEKLGLGLASDRSQVLHGLIKDSLASQEKEEAQRVLYVAMTRAKERLIIGNQGLEYGTKDRVSDYFSQELVLLDDKLVLEEGLEPSPSLLDENLDLNGQLRPASLLEDLNYNRPSIKNFSISQYLAFKNCKRSYYFNNIIRLPRDLKLFGPGDMDLEEIEGDEKGEVGFLAPGEKGTIIHKFCQLYRSELDPEDLMEKITGEFGYDYRQVQEELRPYMDNFIKKTDDDFDKIYREEEFKLRLGDYSFTGVIDRINIRGDYVEILDYKTNRTRNRKKLLAAYEEQLLFYSHVVEKILGKKVSRASLFLLGDGSFIDIDLGRERLEETLASLENFGSFVQDHRDLEDYQPGESCQNTCSHYSICFRD